MYKILKNYLENASYTLADAQSRIDYAVARGKITPEQATELEEIAKSRETKESVTTETLDERVTDAELAIVDLGNMIAELLGGGE